MQAAISEFAVRGLHGASTEAIAAKVGISQPYIFKIYGTKKELFLAAVRRVYDDTLAAFRAGLARGGDSPLQAMGVTFEETVTNRDELLMLLQSVASTADEEVRVAVHDCFHELYVFVQEQSQASDYHVQQFLGYGLMIAAMRGVGLERTLHKQ